LRSLVLILLFLAWLSACKQKSAIQSTNSSAPSMKLADTLTLTFASRGEGPDRQAVPEFRVYQEKTIQRLGKNIFSSPKFWGREGEHDIYVVLRGLSSEEQTQIQRELTEFDLKYDLVFLKVYVKKP
jgi:hypothetical protein